MQIDMKAIIGGKTYNTATATLIAGDDYWDGNNSTRSGRNTHLYESPKGQFFLVTGTQWQGEQDSLSLCTSAEAKDFWESVPEEERAEYATAFGKEPEEG